MEVKGKIKVIGKTESFGKNGFRKRELVVTTEEQYPQSILLEFVQDKTDILDKYTVGDSVDVGINLRGREWVNPQGETKYFNSIQGWKISKSDSVEKAVEIIDSVFEPAGDLNTEDKNDLPF
jgi:hypothetical protein